MSSWRYHVPPRTSYREGATPAAVERAAKGGWWAIDLDARKTLDGIEVVCHWADITKEGLSAPGIPAHSRIENLTWAQVKTLRTNDGDRVYTLSEMLRACGIWAMVACIEAKRPDPRWKQTATWKRIKAMAARHGATVQATAVRRLWGRHSAAQVQAAAQRAGIPNWHRPTDRPKPVKEHPVPPKTTEPPLIEQAYSLLWRIINEAKRQGKTGYARKVWLIAAMFNRLGVRPKG